MTDYVATRWYRSPELLLSPRYGPPADVWAVGCVMGELLDGQPMFPGDDTIDQIHQIMGVLGPFDEGLLKLFFENAALKNLRFPEITTVQTLEMRYRKKIDKTGLHLLNQLLALNEKQRFSADQALRHPFFADLLREDAELAEELRTPQGQAPVKTLPSQRENVRRESLQDNKENNNARNRAVASDARHAPSPHRNRRDGDAAEKPTFNLNKDKSAAPTKSPAHEQPVSLAKPTSGQEKEARVPMKTKSENMDYKNRNDGKKFCTANSSNFVLKKVQNFGFSFYDPKENVREKKQAHRKHQKAADLVKSTFFKQNSQGTPASSSRLFPSIHNVRLNNNKVSWGYKIN